MNGCLNQAMLASRLLALDKQPGVRPIRIGDTVCHIIAKAVLTIVRSDVQEATGCWQMCGGHAHTTSPTPHVTRLPHVKVEWLRLGYPGSGWGLLVGLLSFSDVASPAGDVASPTQLQPASTVSLTV